MTWPRNRKHVPGSGPTNAPMLFIGEAPGRQEENKGEPFVGQTGQKVRRILEDHGVDPVRQVRFNNVIGYNPGKIAGGLGTLASIVHANWDNISDDLAVGRPKVIVACGRASLYRLTGQYKITEEHGGVFPVRSLPQTSEYMYDKKDRGLGRLPESTVVVACTHPAAVMRSAIGAGWLRIDRALGRACAYVSGALETPRKTPAEVPTWTPMPEELDAELAKATQCAIDTEFNPTDNKPFLIGISVDGVSVMSFPPTPHYAAVLRTHMMRQDLLKIAHYHVADVAALAAMGVDTRGPWWDSLEGFSHLYPDLPMGLGHVALYYLDHLRNWKWMPTTDEQYNALDVVNAWRIKECEEAEMAEAGILDVFLRERMAVAPLMTLMEDRGLRVDMPARQRAITKSETTELSLLAGILSSATTYFEKRIAAEAGEVTRLKTLVKELQSSLVIKHPCSLHPQYVGLRGKRFAVAPECRCREIHATSTAKKRRAEIAKQRKLLSAPQGRLKRWSEKGFDPGNNDHLRWLLYHKSGLALPPQRKDGSLTANADAVAKLGAHPKVMQRSDYAEIVQLLKDIKDVQHERKRRSTFLFAGTKGRARIDFYSTVHPPMRAFGTGTGRPAGGSDGATEDRRPSPYSFNVLNIPEGARHIYVPHDRLTVDRVVRKRDLTYEEEED